VRLRFIGEYARFDNIENYYNDQAPSQHPETHNLSANVGFDGQSVGNMILRSKMNESSDEGESDVDFGYNGDTTPF
jgi:hypothetical protein